MSSTWAGLREAALRLVLLSVAAAAAGIWHLLADGGGYDRRYGVALMIGAGLVALTSGENGLSRAMTADARAFLGAGPEREDRDHRVLTPVGVLLFVAAPMFVAGGLILT